MVDVATAVRPHDRAAEAERAEPARCERTGPTDTTPYPRALHGVGTAHHDVGDGSPSSGA